MSPLKPITIAGGGLAGLTLGVGLRQREIPVVIWEAGNYPRHRVCGEFISGNGQAVLARLGLLARFEQAGAVRARTVIFINGTNRSPVRQLAAPALCLSRYKMDALLAESFQQLGGELRMNSRWSAGDDGDGVVHAAGRRVQAAGNGAHWFGVKAHVAGSTPVKLDADLEMHLSPDGYVGVSRINGGEVNVCGLFRARPGHRPPESRLEWLRGKACGAACAAGRGAVRAGFVLLRRRSFPETATRRRQKGMLPRRRADNDAARHRQRHVHGLRVGGNRHRTAGRLQPGPVGLDAGAAADRPALRRGLFAAAGLGSVPAMDDYFTRAAKPGRFHVAAVRICLAVAVPPDAVVPRKNPRAGKIKSRASN